MNFRHLALAGPKSVRWSSVFGLLWPQALADIGLGPQVSALEVRVPLAGPMGSGKV